MALKSNICGLTGSGKRCANVGGGGALHVGAVSSYKIIGSYFASTGPITGFNGALWIFSIENPIKNDTIVLIKRLTLCTRVTSTAASLVPDLLGAGRLGTFPTGGTAPNIVKGKNTDRKPKSIARNRPSYSGGNVPFWTGWTPGYVAGTAAAVYLGGIEQILSPGITEDEDFVLEPGEAFVLYASGHVNSANMSHIATCHWQEAYP